MPAGPEGEVEQLLLALLVGHLAQKGDLVEAQPSLGQGHAQPMEPTEGAGHGHVAPGPSRLEAVLVGQPRGHVGHGVVVAHLAAVALGHEGEESHQACAVDLDQPGHLLLQLVGRQVAEPIGRVVVEHLFVYYDRPAPKSRGKSNDTRPDTAVFGG